MEINQQRIEDAIVAEVANKMIGDDELYSRVKSAVEERINKHFVERADDQIKAAVDEAIRTGFDREYHRVNGWGEKQGEKTTIRKELEKLIGDYWNAKVDKSGKPSSGFGADYTRAEWVMMQMVAADFQGAMKQHVVNLAGSLKDGLRSELHETVNKLLSDTFNVKSMFDQGKDRRDRSIIQPPVRPA